MSSDAAEPVASFQEAALPDHLAVLPRLDVGATYLLAGGEPAGDWFDVVPARDGCVVLAVGDVAGRGAGAVAASLQLRAVLHERLRAGLDLAAAVAATDAFARHLPGAVPATVCVVELEVRSGRIDYVTAGHDPPVVADPDGRARVLASAGGSPLGLDGAYSAGTDQLVTGDLVVLHTGGHAVADLVGGAFTFVGGGHGIRSTVDRVCDLVLEGLLARGGIHDDVGVLAAELMPAPYGVDLQVPLDISSVATVRRALWDWLQDLRAGDHDTVALMHAVGELVTNAVQHAGTGRPDDGEVAVEAHLEDDGCAVVTVQDRGRWREPVDRGGRGLALARGLVDELRIAAGVDGTTAVLRHRIGRPARIFREHAPAAVVSVPFDVRDAGPGRVAVHGAVDEDAVEALRAELLLRAQGGTAALVVDLSDVTLLVSAGVRVLAESLGWQPGAGTLALVAASGCAAQVVLERAGLPYSEG